MKIIYVQFKKINHQLCLLIMTTILNQYVLYFRSHEIRMKYKITNNKRSLKIEKQGHIC